jgi:tetratricopeptide (TPR) repeat protein
MSPEQAAGKRREVGPRSDVYGLGVVLYELRAERRPFDFSGLSLAAACRLVTEQDVVAPGRVRPGLPRELDWIVQRALAKERDRRYASVADFLGDLRRFRRDEPVQAAPPGAGYVLRKFLRRHRTIAAAAGVVLATAAAAFVAVAAALVRARDAEAGERTRGAEATASATRAEAALQFLLDVFATASPDKTSKGRSVTMGEALDRAARDFERRFAEQPAILAALGRTIGRAYHGLGDYAAAERHLRGSLAVHRQSFPDRTEDLVRLHVDLAEVHLRGEQLASARAELERAEALFRAGRSSDRLRLVLRMQRGDLQLAEGDKALAAATLRDAVAELRRRFGDEDRDVLVGMNLLGGTLFASGDLEGAEPLFRAALEGCTAVKGEDHPDTLAAAMNLAMLLFSRKAPDAVSMTERVLQARRRVLGPDHADTLGVLVNLGGQHYMLGNLDAAMELWREGLANAGKLPREHPVVQTLLMNVATVERDRGNWAAASAACAEMLDVRRRTLGQAHERTLVALTMLADIHRNAGDLARADARFREALAIAQQAEPPDLPNVYRSQLGLGRTAAAAQQFEDSERALLWCRDHFDAATAKLAIKGMLVRVEPELAKLYAAWGRTDEAARYRAIVEDASWNERAGGTK